MKDQGQAPTQTYELGARWDGEKTRFAVFSANASAIDLCLFDDGGGERRIAMRRGDDGVWRAALTGVGPGQLYGYRAHGPWQPRDGHRFDPGKLLMDPLARAITGGPRWHPSLASNRPSGEDSAAWMPRCVVVDDAFDWQDDRPLRTSWRDTVIYECHVRGMTKLHPEVDDELRGTYLGLAAPAVVEHLQSLGVTAVELMPVHQIASEPHLQRRGLRNYWGYSPLGFCAPHAGYATGGRGEQVTEFKTMVRELHRAGIEVLLDVVFNHTAEVDHQGPVLSLRGLDNRGYYRLRDDDATRYVDFTGCGNTLDFRRVAVRRLVLESLHVWVREMHVDGFRFDLATVLGRGSESGDGFDARAALFEEIAADPLLSGVKLVAEPWDLGPDGYRLGRFPDGWGEWNDRFRDTVRRFWRGDPGVLADLATRFAGSRDLFASKGPLRSVHYVTCHDGFTLADLVSYERRHNQANGEHGRDGTRNNSSRNWGHEGSTDDTAIRALRARAQRNLFATLALSQGVPMLLHGDEIGRSQGGNNNAYCQDNEVAWVDWSNADQELLAFCRHLLAIRKRYPALRQQRFSGGGELSWWHPEGREMTSEYWRDPERRAVAILLRDDSAAGDLLLFLNGGESEISFELPGSDSRRGDRWRELVDTASSPKCGPRPIDGSQIVLQPFSLRLLSAI